MASLRTWRGFGANAFILAANTSGEVTKELVRGRVKISLRASPLANSLVVERKNTISISVLLVPFARVRRKWRIHHQKSLAHESQQLHRLPHGKKFH